MLHAFVLATVLVLALLGALAAALAGMLRRVGRQRKDEISPVSRQHFELFQGEPLNEDTLEGLKSRYRQLMEQGDTKAIESTLRPGTQFVMQIRALAELGTAEAGRILERQVGRKLSSDALEQLWYSMDLACGLRALNHTASLPTLMRCADAAPVELPLSHYLAVETVSFLGIAGYLRQTDSEMGRVAVRVLRRAIEGIRRGVEPSRLAEARVGDLVEILWDSRPARDDPRVALLLIEVIRVVRRLPAYEDQPKGNDSWNSEEGGLLDPTEGDLEGWTWQASRLVALEPGIRRFLSKMPLPLARCLGGGSAVEEAELLTALTELKADVSDRLVLLLERRKIHNVAMAVRLLAYARAPHLISGWLVAWTRSRIDQNARALWRPWGRQSARSAIPADFPYLAILDCLGRLGCADGEEILLAALRDHAPSVRRAAAASLGWREPIAHDKVRAALHIGRSDPSSDVKYAVRAALARLGEVQSLQMFKRGLESEDLGQKLVSIHAISTENIGLLWPDLDALTDSEDPVLSHHAREAVAMLADADAPGLGQ
jgi:hypothetical protein